MKQIEAMLAGKMNITDFMRKYINSGEMHAQIQSLIPSTAINDENHEFWNGRSTIRNGLSCYRYDVRDMLFSHCGLGESAEDRMEIFNTVRSLYAYSHPNFRYTDKYEDEISFRIDIAGDYYGGKAVDALIDEIAARTVEIRPKILRKKEAKRQIEELFHTNDSKKPRWIQGPDWPMGKLSPMRFVSQQKFSDGIDYTFKDVDTDELYLVREYY